MKWAITYFSSYHPLKCVFVYLAHGHENDIGDNQIEIYFNFPS